MRDGNRVRSITAHVAARARARTFTPARAREALERYPEAGYYEDQSQGTAMFIGAVGVMISILFSIGAMIGA